MLWKARKPLDLKVDMHSHLIPAVDDGVKSLEESLKILAEFERLGYKKVITTPHISESYYPNKSHVLKDSFGKLKASLENSDLCVQIELGAEYMIDEYFLEEILKKEELLSWSDHLLVESSFVNYPMILDETMFEIQQKGLIPVYAHPERYPYFHEDWEKLQELKNRGIQLQINAGSLVGHYGPAAKKMAQSLLKMGFVDFIGSDTHRIDHIKNLEKALRSKSLKGFQSFDFHNNELL